VPHRENAARAVQPDRAATRTAPKPATPAADPVASESAELDRVLDKISASGIDSLSADERRFLDGVSRRRKDGAS
jgi:hypothetical protein